MTLVVFLFAAICHTRQEILAISGTNWRQIRWHESHLHMPFHGIIRVVRWWSAISSVKSDGLCPGYQFIVTRIIGHINKLSYFKHDNLLNVPSEQIWRKDFQMRSVCLTKFLCMELSCWFMLLCTSGSIKKKKGGWDPYNLALQSNIIGVRFCLFRGVLAPEGYFHIRSL